MAKRAARKNSSTPGTRESAGDAASKTPNEPESSDLLSQLSRLHVWQVQAVRDVLLVAAIIAVFWAGYALRAVTVPLLVALLLAYLFEPLIVRMCAHPKISRTGAVTILLVSAGGTLVLVLALALPLVIGQTMEFVEDVRDGTMRQRVVQLQRWVPQRFESEFERLVDQLPGGLVAGRPAEPEAPPDSAAPGPGDEPPPADAEIDQIVTQRVTAELGPIREEIAQLRQRLEEGDAAGAEGDGMWALFKRSLSTLLSVIGTIIGIGLLAFLIPFYFFFFSLWYPEVVKAGRSLIPEKNRDRWLDLMAKMDAVVAGFVRGRIVISIIMGIMLAVGWLLCGVPYAIPLGLIVGVFCAVPYLGGIGIPLAVGLLFFEQLSLPAEQRTIWLGWFGVVLWPTLWFGVVQTIEGYVLTPMIAGKATKLDPVTIVVVVLAGGSVLGVYGMLLAIPVAACGKILFAEILLPKIRAWTRGEIADPLPIERD